MDTNQMNNSNELTSSQKLSRDVFMGRSVLDFEKDDKILKDLPESSSHIQSQGHYRLAKLYYDKSDLLKAEEYF